jgi:hypothetical protein
MSKQKKRSFEELVKENKLQILRDEAAREDIEKRVEKKLLDKERWQVT